LEFSDLRLKPAVMLLEEQKSSQIVFKN